MSHFDDYLADSRPTPQFTASTPKGKKFLFNSVPSSLHLEQMEMDADKWARFIFAKRKKDDAPVYAGQPPAVLVKAHQLASMMVGLVIQDGEEPGGQPKYRLEEEKWDAGKWATFATDCPVPFRHVWLEVDAVQEGYRNEGDERILEQLKNASSATQTEQES